MSGSRHNYESAHIELLTYGDWSRVRHLIGDLQGDTTSIWFPPPVLLVSNPIPFTPTPAVIKQFTENWSDITMSSPLTDHDSTSRSIEDANATRYLTLVAVIMMLYDHILTLPAEYKYVWKTRHSVLKYTFVLHRYVVPCALLAAINESCGFNHFSYSDRGCQGFMTSICVLGTLSIVTSTFLVLRRVLALWNGNKSMRIFLLTMYFLSMCVTISLGIVSFKTLMPSVMWSDLTGMCRIGSLPMTWTVFWGAPTFFELIVVISVVYNSFATPRSDQFPLRRALQNDGIIFFLTLFVLRFFNMLTAALVTDSHSSLAFVAVFFMWGSVATAFSRSLFRLREAESRQRKSSAPLVGPRPSRYYGHTSETGVARMKPIGEDSLTEILEIHPDIHIPPS